MITGYSPELGFLRILDISKIIIISTHNSIFLLEMICSNPLSMSECCDSSTIGVTLCRARVYWWWWMLMMDKCEIRAKIMRCICILVVPLSQRYVNGSRDYRSFSQVKESLPLTSFEARPSLGHCRVTLRLSKTQQTGIWINSGVIHPFTHLFDYGDTMRHIWPIFERKKDYPIEK